MRTVLANRRTLAALAVYDTDCIVDTIHFLRRALKPSTVSSTGWGEPDLVRHGDGRIEVMPNDGSGSGPL